MKTNHQRNFVQKRFCQTPTTPSVDCLDGTRVSAFGGDYSCWTRGNHGYSRDKRGAKSFVNTRRRRRDRDYLKTLDTDKL